MWEKVGKALIEIGKMKTTNHERVTKIDKFTDTVACGKRWEDLK